MNKYQAEALKILQINLGDLGFVYSKKAQMNTSRAHISQNDEMEIRDDHDIHSKDYVLHLKTGKLPVEMLIDGQWIAVESGSHKNHLGEEYSGIAYEFNIDKRPEKMRISLPNNVVDPIEVVLNYHLTTKEEYEQRENNPDTLRKRMEVSCRTSENLVNIYWKHAKENGVGCVCIELYLDNGERPQLMGRYKIGSDLFFKSINGLADGDYCFKLSQFDTEEKEIVSTDFIHFTIGEPEDESEEVVYGFKNQAVR